MSDNHANDSYTNISDLPTMSEVTSPAYVPVEDEDKAGHKVDLSTIKAGTLNTTSTVRQTAKASESLSGNIILHKVAKTGSYSDLLDKPSTAFLDTLSTTALEPAGYETIKNTVHLHKVSKTGKYDDILNKPILNTDNWGCLDYLRNEPIDGTINLHAIAKSGHWYSLSGTPTAYELSVAANPYSITPNDTADWHYGVPMELDWAMTESDYNNTEGSKHPVLCNTVTLDFDDEHLLGRSDDKITEVDSSTEIIVYIDDSFEYDKTSEENPGIEAIVDLYARIVGRDDTKYGTTHPFSVKLSHIDEETGSDVRVVTKTLTCISGASTLDITKNGYVRITGLMTYEIVQP